MDVDIFIKKFEEEFNDLPKGSITPGTRISDMKDWWDSLNVMLTIVFVLEYFGVDIEKNDIFEAKTINDLFITIQKKGRA